MRALICSPPSIFFFSDHHHSSSTQLLQQLRAPQHQQLICLSSVDSSSSAVEEKRQDSNIGSVVDNDSSDALTSSGCKACGKEEIERGCNGEGRIQGGVATIPGFGWWPIKAYRPCPGFVASGGNYRRRGQSLDEVAFGRGKGGASIDDFDEEERKKGKNRRQFKS